MNWLSNRDESVSRARGNAAFSLIELLIVITILGSIAGGIYGIYDSSAENARKNSSLSKRKALKEAIEHYFARHDKYPPSLQALTKSYLSKIPDDPMTDYQGCDWLVKGPRATDSWVSSRFSTSPADGIFDVRSASGI